MFFQPKTSFDCPCKGCRKMSLRPVTPAIHYHHCSLSKMERSRRWRRLVQVLGWKRRWTTISWTKRDMMWTWILDFEPSSIKQWLPKQAPIWFWILCVNASHDAFFDVFWLSGLCVWGDLVKLVNLQMAGLNEQQGYVLKLTSAEGYKEERVKVGIEGNGFFVFSWSILPLKFNVRSLKMDACNRTFVLRTHWHSHCLFTFTLNILFSHPEITE